MVDGLDIARKFHDLYELLAPDFGETTKVFNPDSPNGRLMIAVCRGIGDAIANVAFKAGYETGLREGKGIKVGWEEPQ